MDLLKNQVNRHRENCFHKMKIYMPLKFVLYIIYMYMSYLNRFLLAILTSLWSISTPTILWGLKCWAMASVTWKQREDNMARGRVGETEREQYRLVERCIACLNSSPVLCCCQYQGTPFLQTIPSSWGPHEDQSPPLLHCSHTCTHSTCHSCHSSSADLEVWTQEAEEEVHKTRQKCI